MAAPLTGAVGYSLTGEGIYNALETGFSRTAGPPICAAPNYFSAGGLDLTTARNELTSTCGTTTPSFSTHFGDICGGRASPYHYNGDLLCAYAPNSLAPASTAAAHSPLIGIALDGRGIYGAWEGNGRTPALDACGGHVGPVPGTASVSTDAAAVKSATNGITGLASGSTYHYHTS